MSITREISADNQLKLLKNKSVKKKKFYGELDVALVVKSHLDREQFMYMFDDSGLEATLTLKTPDGKIHKTEVLDIIANWDGFEEWCSKKYNIVLEKTYICVSYIYIY